MAPSQGDMGLDRGRAWLVLAASFLSFVVIGGNMYGVGLIHSALLERYQQDIAKTAWAGALNAALVSAGGPLSSFLVDRFSCRVAIMTSGALYTVGYFATAFAPSLEMAIFTSGVVAGLGGAAGYTAAMVVVGFNFRRRRNVAMGIAVAGVGLGLFILAPVMQMAREYYGTSGFFIILSGITLQLEVFGAFCWPSELELETKRMRIANSIRTTETKGTHSSSVGHYLKVFKNRAIICLCLNMFFYCVGVHLLFLHLPSYAVSKGFSHMQASFFLSIVGVLTVVGRVLTGFVANTHIVDDLVIYAGTLGILCLATFLFPLYSSSFAGQVVFSVILGTFFGSCYVVMGSINIQFVGVEYMALAIGLEFCFGGIGAVIGPVVAGTLLDAGGTYQLSITVSAACMLLGTGFGFLTQLVGHRLPAEEGVYKGDLEIDVPPGDSNPDVKLLDIVTTDKPNSAVPTEKLSGQNGDVGHRSTTSGDLDTTEEAMSLVKHEDHVNDS